VTAGGDRSRETIARQRLPKGGRWRVRGREIPLDRPIVVGILNLTPDSFSDGGRFDDPVRAVAHAEEMLAAGADVIDVGGESTRPQGARPVSAAEELSRILPVVRTLARRFPDAAISVDTVKSEVAEAALGEGARIVNDVSGFRLDPDMAKICGAAKCGVVLMHSRGNVSTMATYDHAVYDDVIEGVRGELAQSLAMALAAEIEPQAIVLDPGIGFAKRSEHSLAMLAGIPRLLEMGHDLMVGASRKRFVGELTGVERADERVHGSVGAIVAALMLGARLFRVHDVAASRQALDVAWAVLQARSE
jgi:dihydropteroate synthase